MLRKLFLSSIAFIGLTGLANAADLYVKAAPIYVPTWTGCYVGGHAGHGTEQSNDQYTFLPTYNQSAETPQIADYLNRGFAGGGQAGCQLQAGAFLWGIEGDSHRSVIKTPNTTSLILPAEYLHYAVASNTPLPQNMTPITGILTGPGLGDHVHLGDADVVRVGASWLFNFGR
jgi:opacity protein-like surface antigen